MTNLTNDIKEKLEITCKTIDVLEKTITVISGEKRQEEKEPEEPKMDSVFRDLDKLNKNLVRILKDVEVLDAMVSGCECTCMPG